MHITDLQIDRFGIWHDLTLPLSGPGLNVFYGPNEAGKSTLMRFARSVLYGGLPPRLESDAVPTSDGRVVASGAIRIADGRPGLEDLHHTIRRIFWADGRNQVQVVGPQESALPTEKLKELLADTPAAIFDRLFAVDLYELQELATLDHADLAEHLYGASVGPLGKQLIAQVNRLQQDRELLLSRDGKQGRLIRMLNRYQSLTGKLNDLAHHPHLYSELTEKRRSLDDEINRGRERRSRIMNELRGRRHMARVYPLWKQVRQTKRELSELPPALNLPPDGIRQLDALDQEQATFARRRDERLRVVAEKERKIDAIGPEPEILRYEPAIRAMLGLRPWIKDATESRRKLQSELQAADASAQKHRLSLGGDKAGQGPVNPDEIPQGHVKLGNAARVYRSALARRADLRKLYQKHQTRLRKEETRLQDQSFGLGGNPQEVAEQVRTRIGHLEKMLSLTAKEDALGRRSADLRRRLDGLNHHFEIPPWVTLVFALFAIGGGIFAILGLMTWVTQGWLVGGIYLLLGLTCGSLSVRLRSHFEEAIQKTADAYRDQRRYEEVELRRLREEITKLANEGQPPAVPQAGDRKPIDPTDVLCDEAERLVEAEQMTRDQKRYTARRKMLTKLRARLRKAQQNLDAARHDWCQTLTSLGLQETLDLDAAMEQWQRISNAAAINGSVVPARRELDQLEYAYKSVTGQIDSFGAKLGLKRHHDQPLETMAEWERELDRTAAKMAERRKLEEEAQQARNDAAGLEEKMRELDRQRTSLLAAAGVKSRAEYEEQLELAEKRKTLSARLQRVEAEYQQIALSEPELAIVQEDLKRFKAEENSTILHQLTREQEELEARIERLCEERGQYSSKLDELEQDEEFGNLRGGLSRLKSQIRETMTRALAAAAAAKAAEQARQAFERNYQPPVLEEASKYLARLTRNRYRTIRVPFGTRSLRIEDAHGRSLAVEQLSGGTREQLFLALRLGLVRQAASEGKRLPMILDDVFVNFDQMRTEAAFETLMELAEQGQQILFFTCHLHLAQLAEQQCIEPIWLPSHDATVPQRLAG